jgi:hypothetical protein
MASPENSSVTLPPSTTVNRCDCAFTTSEETNHILAKHHPATRIHMAQNYPWHGRHFNPGPWMAIRLMRSAM